jgi:hypothetical protein
VPTSERLHYFADGTRRSAVALAVAPADVAAGWQRVRAAMVREVPADFTRDEWAYLMTFVAASSLQRPFAEAFGAPAEAGPVDLLAAPRGRVAVWLPNNVTLLGPLTVVLLSLAGVPVDLKVGTRGDDLTAAWVEWLRLRAPEGPLRDWLHEQVGIHVLERDDPRQAELSKGAAVRMMFGSDEAVQAIERLEHAPTVPAFAFGDQASEAWIEPARIDDDLLRALVRVFGIFGQAGCTSPRRVVLLGARVDEARAVRDRLVELWPEVVPAPAPMNIASQDVAAAQRAAIAGWDAQLVEGHRAVVCAGGPDLPIVDAVQCLSLVAADLPAALASAPSNLQTIGHAVQDATDPRWLAALAATGALRFVPLGEMHHFGPTWDGFAFWRGLFREVPVTT